jgi:hypothetical protein
MPLRARSGTASPQSARDQRAEFQHPAPDRFVRDVETALGEQFLNVSVAQGKAEIKPYRVLNDLDRKAMAPIRKLSHGSW